LKFHPDLFCSNMLRNRLTAARWSPQQRKRGVHISVHAPLDRVVIGVLSLRDAARA
jgi:hypothetical protein